MHTNLFTNGHSTSEVYRFLVKDYTRDSRTLQILDGLAIACLLGGLNDWLGKADLFWFGFWLCAAAALRYFIDQSNRKHLLHKIDWDFARENEKR